jgi:hypothetical protein
MDGRTARPVGREVAIREAHARKAFRNEQNSFDVTKHNRRNDSTRGSAKPVAAAKPSPAPKLVGAEPTGPRPKHARPPAGADVSLEALRRVQELGGLVAAKAHLAKTEKAADDLRRQAEQKYAEVTTLKDQITAAEKVAAALSGKAA